MQARGVHTTGTSQAAQLSRKQGLCLQMPAYRTPHYRKPRTQPSNVTTGWHRRFGAGNAKKESVTLA
jgi:hypothetical protein